MIWDSSPSNGNPPDVNEDDEAVVNINGDSNSLPDLQVSDLLVTNVSSGETTRGINASFTLQNTGDADVSGNYVIRAYISNDNQFSSDDRLLFAEVPTGNTPAGAVITNVQGSFVAPKFTPFQVVPGDYFLFVKVDFNEVIAESNENNNISNAGPFHYT